MALTANELRIGNKVYYTVSGSTKYIGEITKLWKSDNGITGTIDYHYPLSFGEPIPLSPEILEKIDWAGFKKLNINSYFGIDEVGHLYYHNDYTGINIDYLHQLQNWYYLIRNEELIFKP